MSPTEFTKRLKSEGTKLVGISRVEGGYRVAFYLDGFLWQSVRPITSLESCLEARLRLLEAACDNLKGQRSKRLREAARASHKAAMALVAGYRAEGYGLDAPESFTSDLKAPLTTQYIKAL